MGAVHPYCGDQRPVDGKNQPVTRRRSGGYASEWQSSSLVGVRTQDSIQVLLAGTLVPLRNRFAWNPEL